MPNRYKNIDFVKTFASIPPDIIDLMQKREEEQNARDFALLCEGLQHGMCYLLLLSAKHVFVSNYTVFGERQAPS